MYDCYNFASGFKNHCKVTTFLRIIYNFALTKIVEKEMKRTLFFFLLCLLSLRVSAINLDSLMNVEKKEAHKIPRQMLTFSFNINTASDETFSYQFDYQWYALKYMGIGFGMEYDKNDVADQQMRDENHGYGHSYDKNAVTRLNFLPMLSFRTPTVWFAHDRSWGVMLRCDPMLVMSVPKNDVMWITPDPFPGTAYYPEGNVKVKNHGGKWLAWRIRNALSFYNELGMISVGVSFSDYNLYSCRNHMMYKGTQVFNRGLGNTTTVFISLGACL